MLKIYPSLMAAKTPDLKAVAKLLDPYCAGFHLDIMDGHFVPTTGLSPQMVNDIDAATHHPSWVHLMVQEPMVWIAQLKLKRDSMVSFHIELGKDTQGVIAYLKKQGWKAGIALRPKSPIERALPYLNSIDQLIIMSVDPGYSGQPFLPETLRKIAPLLQERGARGLNFEIGMDGGINQRNIAEIAAAGTSIAAVGAAIFAEADPVRALREINELCR